MDIIRHQLDELGMTQRELAEEIDVTEVSVSRWLNCERIPKWFHFKAMLNVVGLKIKLELKN